MIKRLKWQFVLILMLVVALILSVVSAGVYFAVRSSAAETARGIMQRSLADVNVGHTPFYEPQSNQVPHFTVSISPLGRVSLLSGNLSVSDDLLVEICTLCLSLEADEGTLDDYGLRYMRAVSFAEIRIAFADMSFESSVLRGLIRVLLTLNSIVLVLFFGLSLLLSSWAVRPIAQSWEAQRRFVADASHELGTPLAVISSNLDLVAQSTEDDPETQTRISRIRTESDRMKKLTEQMLTLARTENSAKKADLVPFKISETAAREALLFEPVFFEAGLGFEYDIEPALTMPGDESQLSQILSILLDNARKYAAANTAVSLTLERTTRRTAELKVQSFGQVISPEQLQHIFDRFYRLDAARSEGGHGLGLAIAKSLAAENRCTLRAESDAENGTVFTLTVPVSP